MRAAVYVRISEDALGLGLGVARQERDCRELAAGLGWTVEDVYSDNSVSASSGKARPAYTRMLADLASGKVDALVCWDVDRLTRRPVELEHVIDLADRHGISLASVGGEIDLATPQGRLTARIKASVARHEVEQSSRRLKRKVLERAEAGKPHGRVAYGWRRVEGRDVVDPEQAAVFRELVERLLCGESLRSLVADLNRRGFPGPRGAAWERTQTRQILRRERNVGLRRHQGKVIGAGDWEPLIDKATQDRVSALLSDPARRTSRVGTTNRHLLSGLALCGLCDTPLRVLAGHGTHPPGYGCPSCFRVRRKQEPVDALVSELVVARLSEPDALTAFVPPNDQPLIEEANGVRARLDLLADQYANDEIDRVQLARISSRLRQRLSDVEGQLRQHATPDLADLAVSNIAQRWNNVPMGRKRAVINLLVEVRVLPLPKGHRGGPFDPAYVHVEWRASAEDDRARTGAERRPSRTPLRATPPSSPI